MIIGDRLRAMRETKQLSQGDIEKRTGLLRCYISRVENGHTVPGIDTLEQMARELEGTICRFVTYEEKVKPSPMKYDSPISNPGFGDSGKEATYLGTLVKTMSK